MDSVLLIDAVRGVHLLGLAFGLGFAIKADHIAFRFVFRSLKPTELDTLANCHKSIWLGLTLFWISGAALLWFRTGLVPGAFSQKLILKLAVVSLLTANAVFIGRYAMPVITSWHGARLGELPFSVRARLGILGGISAASWASALTLGVFSGMKVMDTLRMYEVVGAVYFIGITGAVALACIAPAILVVQSVLKGQDIDTCLLYTSDAADD